MLGPRRKGTSKRKADASLLGRNSSTYGQIRDMWQMPNTFECLTRKVEDLPASMPGAYWRKGFVEIALQGMITTSSGNADNSPRSGPGPIYQALVVHHTVKLADLILLIGFEHL